MLPWYVRNANVFGTPLVGGAVFVRDYDDLFVFQQPLTFEYWVNSGIEAIFGNIGRALLLNLATIAGALCILYFPMALI